MVHHRQLRLKLMYKCGANSGEGRMFQHQCDHYKEKCPYINGVSLRIALESLSIGCRKGDGLCGVHGTEEV